MTLFSFLPHLPRQPPKFGSLDALKQAGAGGGEDSDEDEQKFFVGGMGKGGGGSGQSVIDPKKIMESAQVRVPCDLCALQACDWAAFDRAVPSMPARLCSKTALCRRRSTRKAAAGRSWGRATRSVARAPTL